MDDAVELRAPVLLEEDGGQAPASEASHDIVVHADFGPPVAPAPDAAPQAAPEPVHRVTLDDYCAAKSRRMHGHVELISAFGAIEAAGHHLLDTPENYDTAFDALRARPAK